MKRSKEVRRAVLIAVVIILAFPSVAKADVALPTIAIAFGSPLWLVGGLGAVVAIESVVLWATATAAGLVLWQALVVASATNAVSTLIGIPLAWLLTALASSLLGGTGLADITTRSGRIEEAVWCAPWIAPHEYVDWDAYQGEWDWIIPTKVLVLLIPFFLASWLIEHAIATRMAPAFAEPVGVGVLIGNGVTYGLMALVAACFLVRNLRRAAPINARKRAADEQKQELRRLRVRARTAYQARDISAVHDIQRMLNGIRPRLLTEELTYRADQMRDFCDECIARLNAHKRMQSEVRRAGSGMRDRRATGDDMKVV
jgi:hypothetical protein